jgi:hypothetical protein
VHFVPVAVSQEYRRTLINLLPALADPHHLGLASYLLFPLVERDTKRILLSQTLVREAMGIRGHHESAESLVDQFSRACWPVRLTGWVWGDSITPGRCRCVDSMEVPTEIANLTEIERKTVRCDRTVWLHSGKLVDGYAKKELHDRLAKTATEATTSRYPSYQPGSTSNSDLPPTLLNYVNGLKPARFAALRKHLPEAHRVAELLRDSATQHGILRHIAISPKPFYQPAERTSRIHSLNPSLLSLHSDVRNVLTRDWVKADLVSAQLAICARIWGSDIDVNAHRQAGIWQSLCNHMGVVCNSGNRGLMKTGLYSLLYGRGDKQAASWWQMVMPHVADGYLRFCSHPLIAPLLKARGIELRRLREVGHGIDAFGHKVFPRYDHGRPNWSSVMAIVAQSYEMVLLAPVINMALERTDKHGFSITAWLHDGFSFAPHDRVDTDRWIGRLSEEVEIECRRLKVATRLEITRPASS